MKRTWLVAVVFFVLGASIAAVWVDHGRTDDAKTGSGGTTRLGCGGGASGDGEDDPHAGPRGTAENDDGPDDEAASPNERVWIDAGPGHGVFRVSRADREKRTRLETALRAAAARRAAEAPGDEPGGHLDPAYIQDRIHDLQPLLAECYELALADDPTLSGRIVVEFGIAGEPDVGGIVDESRIDEDASDLSHPVLNECVRETLYTAEFDAPEGGGRVTVRYPFVMTEDDEPESEHARGI